jgi:benzoyl-CoA reductase/2-hydroxyglutaryl-CoA dehydratase subunit BcrC/BadD/HgdB
MQRLSDIWRLSSGGLFHADVVWPVKVDGPGAEAYAVEILKAFAAAYAAHFRAAIDDAALTGAAALCNRIRDRVERLYVLQRRRPGRIAGRDLLAVMRAAMVMDRTVLADALDALLETLEKETGPVHPGKRLFLAGGVCEVPDVYEVIESAGATVVGDDLCTGARYAAGRVDADGEIWTALARRYLKRSVCPAKHAGLTRRAEDLAAAAREAEADGVIFLYLKFCDPHLFDYPYLKQHLEAAGLPCLMIELEGRRFSEGQLRTRCEAFVEML